MDCCVIVRLKLKICHTPATYGGTGVSVQFYREGRLIASCPFAPTCLVILPEDGEYTVQVSSIQLIALYFTTINVQCGVNIVDLGDLGTPTGFRITTRGGCGQLMPGAAVKLTYAGSLEGIGTQYDAVSDSTSFVAIEVAQNGNYTYELTPTNAREDVAIGQIQTFPCAMLNTTLQVSPKPGYHCIASACTVEPSGGYSATCSPLIADVLHLTDPVLGSCPLLYTPFTPGLGLTLPSSWTGSKRVTLPACGGNASRPNTLVTYNLYQTNQTSGLGGPGFIASLVITMEGAGTFAVQCHAGDGGEMCAPGFVFSFNVRYPESTPWGWPYCASSNTFTVTE